MKVIKILLLLSIVSFTSCKKIMDVGDSNPNVVENPDLRLILPSAQLYIAHSLSYNYGVVGGIWAQYWTQSPYSSQYKVMDQYAVSASYYDRPWSNLYAGALADLKKMEDRARAGGNFDYLAVSLLLQAYTFQILTDAHGDIPYSEALRAESDGIFNPKYDNQKELYKSLVSMVDEATSIIDTIYAAGLNVTIDEDDLLYHGDLANWWYFANTLKLKMALRWSEADPSLAQTWVSELEAISAQYVGQLGDAAMIAYTNSAGNYNPLYENIRGLRGIQNLWASSTCIDQMNSNADLRASELYTTVSGVVAGIPQGSFEQSAGVIANGSRSLPGPITGGLSDDASETAPVYFISEAEGLLLLAEAEARGWISSGSGAQADFESAIKASFTQVGLAETDADDYIANSTWGVYPSGGSLQDQIKFIITQKYFAMCGLQNFEAWTEQRRTGYPDFFVQSEASQIGSNFPMRFIYPASEVSSNNQFPGQKLIYEKVEWDIN